jgi:hypothetical protein
MWFADIVSGESKHLRVWTQDLPSLIRKKTRVSVSAAGRRVVSGQLGRSCPGGASNIEEGF